MCKNALVYAVSRQDVLLTSISLSSVLEHYPDDTPLDVLIIGDDIFDSDIQLMRSLPQRYHKPQVKVYVFVPSSYVKQIKNYHNEKFPIVITWRLFAPSTFTSYEHLLYLDNDTLIYTDITPFFDLCPADKAFAAVPDFFYYAQHARFKVPEFPELTDTRKYINSGVLVFNVARFNQVIRPEQIIDLLNRHTYRYPDQTVLNQLGVGQMAFLDLAYNYQKDDSWLYWVRDKHPATLASFREASQRIKVRHFVGYLLRSRPWQHIASYDRFERDFWQQEIGVRQFYLQQSQKLGLDTTSRLANSGRYDVGSLDDAPQPD